MTDMPNFDGQMPRAPRVAIIAVGLVVAAMILTMILRIFEDFSWRDILPGASSSNPKIVEQYTRFRIEAIEGGEIVTGYRYGSSRDPEPQVQYCYVEMKPVEGGPELHLELARKSANKPVEYKPISPENAARLGMPVEALNGLARERCRFDEWE